MAPGVVDAARRSTDRARYRVGGLRDGGAFWRAAAFVALAIPTASRIDGPSVRRVGTFTGSGTVHNVRSAGDRSIAAGVDAVLSVPARDAGVLARRPAGCVTCAPAGAANARSAANEQTHANLGKTRVPGRASSSRRTA